MIKKIFLCFLIISCKPEPNVNSSKKSYVRLNPRSQHKVIEKNIIEEDKELPNRPQVNPKSLKVRNLQVYSILVGNNIYPKIQFKRSELSDYVEYQLCSNDNECHALEQTAALEAIIAKNIDGFFIVKVKACVYKERSTDPSLQCGDTSEAPNQIDRGVISDDLHTLIKKRMEYDEQIKEKGKDLLAIIDKYEADISLCRKEYPDLKVSLSSTVIQNLRKMGIVFIGEALISMNSPDTSQEKNDKKTPSEKIQPDRSNINNLLFGLGGISSGVLAYVSISKDLKKPESSKVPNMQHTSPVPTENKTFFQKNRGKILKGIASLAIVAGVAMSVFAIHELIVYGLAEGESIDSRCPANKDVVLDLKELGKKVQTINVLKDENNLKINELAEKEERN